MTRNSINQLLIMTDEHTRKVLGCYGNHLVKTPNLDRLAARGTLFTDAYCNVPICVPSRASFATGRYGHQTRHWDNATPYCGTPNSWAHELQGAGISVGSIGKLHYRNESDSVGLDFQQIPMHIVNGVGDVLGCVREPLPKRWKSRNMAEKIGPGETSYTSYDRDISTRAAEWITSQQDETDPWVLFVSMIAPHFPLIAPQEFYDQYAEAGLMPTKARPNPEHPWHAAMRECIVMDNFTPERTRIALASYYALVTFIDSRIGLILDALDDAGLQDRTQVIYVSDHGDQVGERDLWGKSNMFEESVGIPCIIAGPNVPKGKVCRTPVSLVDVAPTVLQTAGIAGTIGDRPGQSLVDMANAEDDLDRVVFAEYQAMGAIAGAFMIRKGRWKYVHYLGMNPELYDLYADPDELNNLGVDPAYSKICLELEQELRQICTPEQVDQHAREDQARIIATHGGQEFIVSKGGFGATPPPGEAVQYGKS
ncbi:sulfatase-like hydrolase/transferase [Cognatishimia sp. 1_MG-2023]|uniref:sulfatase-like hydrolase/transferase n=1 Tax=Cognatishimia sp. 1_MG-2023 TaxID=3062642 RepID=UPI0026E3AD0D|nr:sulfatase-like hydrolase/transferase [Cognatishimia sp. 1_MG-2023]MDO6728252.1 sulfatase-like hydrolase/transferase [Cognatishimia sp. 1_MG-2023]